MGTDMENSNDNEIESLRKEAETGDAWAQFTLGECYYFGFDCEMNDKEARLWFTKAAEQEDEMAKGMAKEMLLLMQKGEVLIAPLTLPYIFPEQLKNNTTPPTS